MSLKAARDIATEARQMTVRGIDPIAEREVKRRDAQRNLHLLRDVADDAFEARKAELKGDGVAGRWFSPLGNHILPKLGGVPVAGIDQIAVRDTLAPIWHDKAETARKAANRLRIVMQHAAALGLNVDLQAVDKARALLGKQRHEVKNIEALPWHDVPGFYQSLGDGVTELALRLLCLTAARSAAVRFATPDHFDLDVRVWTIPAIHMKGRKGQTGDFRVPLSDEAVTVGREAMRHGGMVLFPGQKGKPISDMTMSKYMRVRGMAARPHGLRSSFRTWAEETGQPYEVAETALGHKLGNKVERAYQRSDLIEKRAVLMEKWSNLVTGKAGGKVVQIRAAT
ncbi:integrase [Rhodobacterales bacterium 56_14_T64]|nr:integrase [Rhodobacterales bacterium 56_14_T64]